IAAPVLDADAREIAAGVRWLLEGDAGQRVIAAWSTQWAPARQASGTDWMQPYLARLLADPYQAVRYQAARSLRSLSAANAAALADYEFTADAAVVAGPARELAVQWRAGYRGTPRPQLLLDEGGLRDDAFERLFARRDDRRVFLAE